MEKRINLVSLIFVFLTISSNTLLLSYTKGLFIGSIQFPADIALVPSIRVFCGGNKIACEKDNVAKRISFTIPEDKRRTIVPFIITQSVQFEVEKDTNTIKYLKLPQRQSYKLYILELLKIAKKYDCQEERTSVAQRADQDLGYVYEWKIREEKNSLSDGRIPDDAVVMYFNPEYVETLSGGNGFELPRVVIKKNLLALAGSEEKLHDFSKSLVLSSLDLNAIHANVESQVTQEQHRTFITLVT